MSTLGGRIEQAVNRAVSEVMNGNAATLPPLAWFLNDGCVRGMASTMDYQLDQVPAVLARWADHLELVHQPDRDGVIEYRGIVENRQVEIWGIVDEAEWERSVDPPLAT